MLFARTFIPAFVFALTLMGCQTVGIDQDPERTNKATIVAATLAVDALAAYGTLPECASGVGDMCKKPKAYADAKLLTTGFAATLGGSDRPSIFLTAGLLYYQWQLSKTIAGAPGPTNPESPPSDAVVKQLAALGLADVLVSTFDARIRDAASPNVTVEELQDRLAASVAKLP